MPIQADPSLQIASGPFPKRSGGSDTFRSFGQASRTVILESRASGSSWRASGKKLSRPDSFQERRARSFRVGLGSKRRGKRFRAPGGPFRRRAPSSRPSLSRAPRQSALFSLGGKLYENETVRNSRV